MKDQKNMGTARRFFRRFNPWLYLVCLLLAAIVWCAAMYLRDPDGLRSAAEATALASSLADTFTV